MTVTYGDRTAGDRFLNENAAYRAIKSRLENAVDTQSFTSLINAMSEVPIYSADYNSPVSVNDIAVSLPTGQPTKSPQVDGGAGTSNINLGANPFEDKELGWFYIVLIILGCLCPLCIFCFYQRRRNAGHDKLDKVGGIYSSMGINGQVNPDDGDSVFFMNRSTNTTPTPRSNHNSFHDVRINPTEQQRIDNADEDESGSKTVDQKTRMSDLYVI
jgi:hypothetical protein